MIRVRLVLPVRLTPLGRWVLMSVAGHVLFAAAVLLMPSLDARPRVPDNIVVELVPVVAPSSRPAAAPPPSPPSASAVPAPAPPRTDPVPVAPKKPPRQPVPPRPEETEPEPAPRRETPPDSDAPPAQPTGEAPTSGREVRDSRGGVAALEAEDVQFAWYRSSVTAALHANWRKPVLDGVAEAYEVTVRFDILRDGSVRGLRIDLPSRVPSLDRSAMRAVRDAAPLPPLPRNWPEDVLPARFVFRLYPE